MAQKRQVRSLAHGWDVDIPTSASSPSTLPRSSTPRRVRRDRSHKEVESGSSRVVPRVVSRRLRGFVRVPPTIIIGAFGMKSQTPSSGPALLAASRAIGQVSGSTLFQAHSYHCCPCSSILVGRSRSCSIGPENQSIWYPAASATAMTERKLSFLDIGLPCTKLSYSLPGEIAVEALGMASHYQSAKQRASAADWLRWKTRALLVKG